MQEFFTIISNFGFPVAVASYLLFRFEKKLDALEATNEEKVKRIDTLVEETKHMEKEIRDLRNEVVSLKKKI